MVNPFKFVMTFLIISYQNLDKTHFDQIMK